MTTLAPEHTRSGDGAMLAVEVSAVSPYWRAVSLDPPPLPAQHERVGPYGMRARAHSHTRTYTPTPGHAHTDTWSDSWGLGTLLLALAGDIDTMRLRGFTHCRRYLCKSARRLGGAQVGDPAVLAVGGSRAGWETRQRQRRLDVLDLAVVHRAGGSRAAPVDRSVGGRGCKELREGGEFSEVWDGSDGACLAYIAAACLRVHGPSRMPIPAAVQRLRCSMASHGPQSACDAGTDRQVSPARGSHAALATASRYVDRSDDGSEKGAGDVGTGAAGGVAANSAKSVQGHAVVHRDELASPPASPSRYMGPKGLRCGCGSSVGSVVASVLARGRINVSMVTCVRSCVRAYCACADDAGFTCVYTGVDVCVPWSARVVEPTRLYSQAFVSKRST